MLPHRESGRHGTQVCDYNNNYNNIDLYGGFQETQGRFAQDNFETGATVQPLKILNEFESQ